MIFEYTCMSCGFISRWIRNLNRYKCPSCDVLVEAVPFIDVPGEPEQELDPPPDSALIGVVDIEKFLKTKES